MQLRGALYVKRLTPESLATVDAVAQFAVTMGMTVGAPTDLFNATFHFELAFILLEISVAILAMYYWGVILNRYSTFVTSQVVIPEKRALLWGSVFTCIMINGVLTLKLLLVTIVYIRNSLYPARGALILLFVVVNVLVSCHNAKTTLHLYSRVSVPRSLQLVLNAVTLCQCKKKVKILLQLHSIFNVSYCIPVASVHLVVTVLAILQDPMQNGMEVLTLFGIVVSGICFFAMILSFDPILTMNFTHFKEKLKKCLHVCVKWMYIMLVLEMLTFFAAVILGLICLDIRSNFYCHYKISHYLWYYLSPVLFGLLSWVIRVYMLHFKNYFARKMSDSE